MYHSALHGRGNMDDEPDERQLRESDLPVDLSQERESFVRQFMRRGMELTEGLLEENKRLHEQLDELQRQNARLLAQIASDDAIRDLLTKIEALERERRELLDKSTELEEVKRRSEHRNVEIEQELHDLANLYIASHHLHTTLSVRVTRHLCELMQQLVGAEIFAIYLLHDDEGVPLASDGVTLADVPIVTPGEGAIGEVLMTGLPAIADAPQPGGSLDAPVAAIPLLVRDEVVGAIAVATVFEQKSHWAAVDEELFKLLGSHAATALLSANLYSREQSPTEALDGLRAQLDTP